MAVWAILLAAAQLTCPPGGDPTKASVRPDWLVVPTAEQMEAAYPPAAVQQELEGRVTLTCEVGLDGVATGCQVEDESSPGYGFGEAALSLVPMFRFRPASDCGVPRPAPITIPLLFRAPEDEDWSKLPPPSPLAIALARQLFEAQGGEADAHWIAGFIRSKLDRDRGQTPLNATERLAFDRANAAVWVESREAVLFAVIEPYARLMSEDELRAAIAFASSPAGRKLHQADDAHYRVRSGVQRVAEAHYQDFRDRYCQSLSACGPDGKGPIRPVGDPPPAAKVP